MMADNKAMKIAKLLQMQLGPQTENMYKSWMIENNVRPSNDYDMRGYFMGQMTGDPEAQSEVNPSDMQMHFTDKYKLPNHPSFSNQSMYDLNKTAPAWVGNEGQKQQLPPYTEGAWGQLGKKGLMNLELPFGKGK
jgi:hypothetical protein